MSDEEDEAPRDKFARERPDSDLIPRGSLAFGAFPMAPPAPSTRASRWDPAPSAGSGIRTGILPIPTHLLPQPPPLLASQPPMAPPAAPPSAPAAGLAQPYRRPHHAQAGAAPFTSPQHRYGGSGSAAVSPVGMGGAGGADKQGVLPFKTWLAVQPDDIDEAEALRLYTAYKQATIEARLTDFFSHHKDEEWFREKYHPHYAAAHRDRARARTQRRLQLFIDMQAAGDFDGVALVDTCEKDVERLIAKANYELTRRTPREEHVVAVPQGWTVRVERIPEKGAQAEGEKEAEEQKKKEEAEAEEQKRKREEEERQAAKSEEPPAKRAAYEDGEIALDFEEDEEDLLLRDDYDHLAPAARAPMASHAADASMTSAQGYQGMHAAEVFTLFSSHVPQSLSRADLTGALRTVDGFLRLALSTPTESKPQRFAWASFAPAPTFPRFLEIVIREHRLKFAPSKTDDKPVRITQATMEDSDKALIRELIVMFDREAGLYQPVEKDSSTSVVEADKGEDGEVVLSEGEGGNPVLRASSSVDLQLLYLRIVHSYDLFNGSDFPIEDDLGKQISCIHVCLSNCAPNMQQNTHWRTKARARADTAPLSQDDMQRLGWKDQEDLKKSFVTRNSVKLSEGVYKCALAECGKMFKTPEFLGNHLLSKHPDVLAQHTIQAEFFNAYIRDPRRPMGSAWGSSTTPHKPLSHPAHPPLQPQHLVQPRPPLPFPGFASRPPLPPPQLAAKSDRAAVAYGDIDIPTGHS